LFRHASEGPDLNAAPAPAAALLPVPTVAVPPGPVIGIEAAPSAPVALHAGAAAVCPAGQGPTDSEGGDIATSAGSKRRREEGISGLAPSEEDEYAGDLGDNDLVVDVAPAADPLGPELDRARARTQNQRVMARPSWGGAAVTEGGLHIAVLTQPQSLSLGKIPSESPSGNRNDLILRDSLETPPVFESTRRPQSSPLAGRVL
jgi:hypothetical protein